MARGSGSGRGRSTRGRAKPVPREAHVALEVQKVGRRESGRRERRCRAQRRERWLLRHRAAPGLGLFGRGTVLARTARRKGTLGSRRARSIHSRVVGVGAEAGGRRGGALSGTSCAALRVSGTDEVGYLVRHWISLPSLRGRGCDVRRTLSRCEGSPYARPSRVNAPVREIFLFPLRGERISLLALDVFAALGRGLPCTVKGLRFYITSISTP